MLRIHHLTANSLPRFKYSQAVQAIANGKIINIVFSDRKYYFNIHLRELSPAPVAVFILSDCSCNPDLFWLQNK